MEKDAEEEEKQWRRGGEGLKMAEGGGELSCREDFVFCLISRPLPSLAGAPSIQ